jgi:hypothetical protein
MILAGNPLSKVNDPRNERVVLANGQFMFFSRESYEVVGGHRAVQHNVLDDVGLAKAVVEADHRLGVVMMQRLFTVRMYSNGVDLWRGWRKNLFPGLNNSFVALFFVVVLSTLFLLLPYVVVGLGLAGLVEGPAFYSALVAVAAIQGLRAYLDGVFGVGRLVGLLTHWIGNAAVLLLMIDSAVSTTRGTAVWKGRQIN